MSKTIVAIVVAVAIVAGGAYVLVHKSGTKTNSTSSSNTQTTSPTNSQSSGSSGSNQNSAATITYSDSGFSPSTLTVKSGTTVTITNNSSSLLQFDSNPHPAHTDDVELNVGTVSPGKSQTFTVTKTGSFGYHNHLNSGDTGMIIVQ